MRDESKGERDTSLMVLGRVECILLFLIYAACIMISTLRLADKLLAENGGIAATESLVIDILLSSSLGGAAIFYARKLYKAGINNEYDFQPTDMGIGRISTFAYYILRLPISALFSLIIYALWRITMEMSTEGSIHSENSARYLFLVMGFFSGFSSGRIISYFERDGFMLARSGGVPTDNE